MNTADQPLASGETPAFVRRPPTVWLPLVAVTLAAGPALWLGPVGAWLVPVAVLGFAPALELVWRGDAAATADEAQVRADPRYDWVLYALSAAVPLVLAQYLWLAVVGRLHGLGLLGAALTTAIVLAAVGLNVAHLLGHRAGRGDQRVALGLLSLLLYGHWRIEHNLGHHVRVNTPEDYATARRGESYYRFLLRGAVGGWRNAWRTEAARLQRQGKSALSLNNEILIVHIFEIMLLGGAWLLGGVPALLAWLLTAGIAIALTESINYIQHYGLMLSPEQRPGNAGMSWNTNGPATRVLLLELGRHSDHHRQPTRPYQILRHVPEHPDAPTGHMGLILLCLVPPLWFRVMNHRLDQLYLAD